MPKLNKILVSDYELTEVYEDEALAIFREGKTTIDFLEIWRCREHIYTIRNKEVEGTAIVFVDSSEIIVKEKYKEIEQIRRDIKAELIKAQTIQIANGMDKG